MAKRHTTETLKVSYVPAPGFNPHDWKKFVEFPHFTRSWRADRLDDNDLRALQLMLTARPDAGPVVPGTGGLRKVRFGRGDSSVGKSGSLRIGYVYFQDIEVIGLVSVFSKSDKGNFTNEERNTIRLAVTRFREWLRQHP